jgi:signal transduction histidine kinase
MKPFTARHKLMAALMITSQLLLTAFVGYWLWGQYRGEWTQLHGQLTDEFSSVQDQLLDSVLMKHLVIPSLDDSILVRIHEREAGAEKEGADTARVMITMQHAVSEYPDSAEFDAIQWEAAHTHDSILRSIDVTSVISDEERMVRSVKLFIDSNPDAFQGDTGVFIYAMNLDSATLVLNMQGAMEKKGWNFSLEWPETDQGRGQPARNRGIAVGGPPLSHLPALLVDHYRGYLIRRILPQILFALVLLVLSASAFLFAYRSLLRQLALSKLREGFISNISHELKTPVSTVKIALEALRTYDLQKDPGQSREYMDMAVREMERLEGLIGKVLQHQMLNHPSQVLQKEMCDLTDLTREVMHSLEGRLRETGAKITLSGEGGSCEVMADRVYLEGTIMNLIDNSMKYGGDPPEIQIKIECGEKGAVLSVTDNGPGIPEEYRNQVFEEFFRIPAGNRHNVKGYGLGLNFAAQVMDQHEGSIDFQNLPEGGCRFTLHFPGRKA